jgi:tryptophan 2,3-dioxygenase
MLKYAAGPAALAALEKRLREPSVVDHFYDFLEHQGVAIPVELREKPVDVGDRPNEAIQRALLGLYTTRPELAILFESMTDLDEGFQEWKYRHVKLVERTIGNKRGTGGSLGVEFLKQSLFQPLFPDLWAIRHEL